MINAGRQIALILRWFRACQIGDFERADIIWELFCKELEK